jgi:hypothetical protein
MNPEFSKWLIKQKYQHARSRRTYIMKWDDVISYKRAYPISTLAIKIKA